MVEDRRAVLIRAQPAYFATARRALADLDFRPVLPKIVNPTLVVVGALAATIPPELARQLAAGIGHAALAEIPDCAHCPPLERPGAFVATIRDFLGLPS